MTCASIAVSEWCSTWGNSAAGDTDGPFHELPGPFPANRVIVCGGVAYGPLSVCRPVRPAHDHIYCRSPGRDQLVCRVRCSEAMMIATFESLRSWRANPRAISRANGAAVTTRNAAISRRFIGLSKIRCPERLIAPVSSRGSRPYLTEYPFPSRHAEYAFLKLSIFA
jgi:hypothetical protein